jgi:hypothetical protein
VVVVAFPIAVAVTVAVFFLDFLVEIFAAIIAHKFLDRNSILGAQN